MNTIVPLLFIFSSFCNTFCFTAPTRRAEMEGVIQFPALIKSQGIKIYQGGSIVETEHENINLFFRIKVYGEQRRFTLVVVKPQDIHYIFKEKVDPIAFQQTVHGRAIRVGSEYRFYECILSGAPEKTGWEINQIFLDENRMIPDDAIVIIYNPNYIQDIRDDGVHRLPTVVIQEDVLGRAGGEQAFRHEELFYILETINSDTLHYRDPVLFAFVGSTKIFFKS